MVLNHLNEGGEGSGNRGHSGRPGQVGGSSKVSIPHESEVQEKASQGIFFVKTIGGWTSEWHPFPSLDMKHFYQDGVKTPETLDEWRALQKEHPEYKVWTNYSVRGKGGVGNHAILLKNLVLYGSDYDAKK